MQVNILYHTVVLESAPNKSYILSSSVTRGAFHGDYTIKLGSELRLNLDTNGHKNTTFISRDATFSIDQVQLNMEIVTCME